MVVVSDDRFSNFDGVVMGRHKLVPNFRCQIPGVAVLVNVGWGYRWVTGKGPV